MTTTASVENVRKINLATFFCLYIAQFIPSTFITTAMQVTMRQANYGLATIGLLHLVHIPWMVKFLWAPMVDRQCSDISNYRRFILLMESVYALSIIPNYPSDIATVNFDRSGTTVIGKYLLNHSFMMPGLVSVIVSTIVGTLITMLIY